MIRTLLYTASESGRMHNGCRLVDEAFDYLLEKHGFQVVKRLYKSEVPTHKTRRQGWLRETPDLPEFDLIIVNAEGATHHSRWPALIQCAQEWPAALINAVWHENNYGLYARHAQYKQKLSLDDFLYLSCRESVSAERMQDQTSREVHVVPDVAFAAPSLEEYRKDTDAATGGGKIVTDRVGWQRDMAYEPDTLIHDRDFIEKVAGADSVATGRFHGALIAAAVGTPFTAWPSNTPKIEGMMEDMGVSCNMYPTRELAIAHTPINNRLVRDYVAQAPAKIHQMFEDIRDAYNARISGSD